MTRLSGLMKETEGPPVIEKGAYYLTIHSCPLSTHHCNLMCAAAFRCREASPPHSALVVKLRPYIGLFLFFPRIELCPFVFAMGPLCSSERSWS